MKEAFYGQQMQSNNPYFCKVNFRLALTLVSLH